MEVSTKRLLYITAYMALHRFELVDDSANDTCYLQKGRHQEEISILYEDIQALFHFGVIELDSGCEEEGYEKYVYRLTDCAVEKLQKIVDEEINSRKTKKRLS